MEGAQLKAEREHDMTMALAWHTAMFALKGYAGDLKGKSLSDFLISKDAKPKRSALADATVFFNTLKAQGIPVRVFRTPRKERGQQVH